MITFISFDPEMNIILESAHQIASESTKLMHETEFGSQLKIYQSSLCLWVAPFFFFFFKIVLVAFAYRCIFTCWLQIWYKYNSQNFWAYACLPASVQWCSRGQSAAWTAASTELKFHVHNASGDCSMVDSASYRAHRARGNKLQEGHFPHWFNAWNIQNEMR